MIRKTTKGYDGTPIAYEVGGSGDRWLVVANGYGGTFVAWHDIFARLSSHYRIAIWDYRGLYSSSTPRNSDLLTIDDNVLDLEVLRRVEGIERMVLVGWSVGVQVALEHFRTNPDSVEALGLICGAHERVLYHSLTPLQRLVGPASRPMLDALMSLALRGAIHASSAVRGLFALLSLIVDSPHLPALLRVTGVTYGEPQSMHEALIAAVDLDPETFFRMLLAANAHRTEAMLASIDVPTLVVAGDRDMITPTELSRHVASQIPQARYVEVAGGTHYAPMEFPELMANLIDELATGAGESPSS